MRRQPLPDPVADVLRARAEGGDLELTTSGTTGTPRTIRRSCESWWASFDPYSSLTGVDAGARVWVPGPLSATMNLFAAVHAAVVGARLVQDPADATHACLTPTALNRRRDVLRSGTHVVVAGGPLPPRLHERAGADGLDVSSYYGAAELSFVASGAHADDLHAFPGVDVEIRREAIWVRSPYLSAGIGPWASVGDRGRLDGDRVVVLGRPGTATTAGATVSITAIEAVLGAHARSPIAVVALPHPGLGEIVAAVLTRGEDLTGIRRAARALPASHRPRRWVSLDALPTTPAGKIDHDAIRTRLSGART